MKHTTRTSLPRRHRGSSLIEVLIAMAILAMLMVGVLQLFSLALITDSGSASRSEMTLKAQQVAENLRYLHFLRSSNPGAVPAGALLASSIAAGQTATLPYDSSQTGWTYWGPDGANVFEEENPAYRISYAYTASPDTPNYLFVTVTVTSGTAGATSLGYVGPSAKVKRVDYVCQVRQ
ncbi:MAG: type IV pilus modification PilV family protein [Thermoanaerobaculia bacterium]